MTVKPWKRAITICALMAAMGMHSTCQAFWKELWGCACTVGGVATAEVGVGIGLIGVQTAIFTSAVKAPAPDATPTEFQGQGVAQPTGAALDAMLALVPPDVDASGTPQEIAFIHACNVVLADARTLQGTTNATNIQSQLAKMSIDLENAANAYDAIGVNQSISQADIDSFQAACAAGTPPSRENDYLLSCGLNQAQLQALNLRLSTDPMTLSGSSLSVSTMLHRAAQLINPAVVTYANLSHTPLGSALIANQLDHGSNRLVVSNLGSSGQDGVEITLPGNLSGLDVGWQDLDTSNTLPVGAYVQEQMIGMSGTGTIAPWGTLTLTKNGTTNYVLSADYSPIGASMYTVQAFLKGVLVGQVTGLDGGALAICGGCCTTYDWEFWPNFGPTIDWGHGTPILLGGAALTADQLYVIPENVTLTGTPTAMQITASQVPSLTITSEIASLVYQGLTNTSVGSATVTGQGNQLMVSGIGSNGVDGVSIAMPSNLSGFDVTWQPLDVSNTLPVGAYVQEQIIGTAGAVTNGVLGTLTMTKTGTPAYPYSVSANYSPVGASNYTVQALP